MDKLENELKEYLRVNLKEVRSTYSPHLRDESTYAPHLRDWVGGGNLFTI